MVYRHFLTFLLYMTEARQLTLLASQPTGQAAWDSL